MTFYVIGNGFDLHYGLKTTCFEIQEKNDCSLSGTQVPLAARMMLVRAVSLVGKRAVRRERASKGESVMKTQEHYETDLLFFFDGKPLELSLYEMLFRRMEAAFPAASVRVQKSQISFYGRHLFAAASLPVRRKRDWPEHCIVVTIGLSHRLESPRVAVAVEPYPNRWTHHVLISGEGQIDDELMGWLREAYEFSENKR